MTMNINIVNNNPYNINYMADVPIENVTVSITGTTLWSGTTNTSGKALDSFNNPPQLPYGSYNILTTKYGYNDGNASFIVPDTTSLTIVMSLITVTIDITVTD